MDVFAEHDIVSLEPERSFWDRLPMLAPLVIIGTRSEDGSYNLAPKHMVTPMGWGPYFGFVCTPRHRTYHNAKHSGVFTVSYPRPSQLVLASLAAAPRQDGPGTKPSLEQVPTLPSRIVDGIFVEDAYLFLECEIERIVDHLGSNSLLIGQVVAVHAQKEALRTTERDPQAMLREQPLLAFLPPDRYAVIDESLAFPFPTGFEK